MAKPRELALKIIYDIHKNGAYLNISFQKHMEESGLAGRDAAFTKELVYGTVSRQLTLDYIISRLSSVKLKKLAPYVLCILRLGLYQLFFMDRVPESAAVNESVGLAGKYAGRSRGFINAILRNAAREGMKLPEGNDNHALSVRYSHPEPLVAFLKDNFGEEKAITILEENNQTPPLSVRVNTLKTTRKDLLERLSGEGVTAKEGSVCDGFVLIEGGGIQALSSYKEGLFTIQDQSAGLAALVLSPAPDDFVLDLCAAPGGKTTHLAELMENKGEIIAYDLYDHRLQSVTVTAERLGISIIKTKAADARTIAVDKAPDKILIDAPCSGLGVIRRRPDIKYKQDLTDFRQMEAIQMEILCHGADLLKAGGELVYSTCTINPGENEKLIKTFLKDHPDFSMMPIQNEHLGKVSAEILKDGMGTFYPDGELGDGFFIAKLKKE